MRVYFLLIIILVYTNSFASLSVQNIWGKEEIDNPLLEEIINSPTMQRLKKIDQSGPIVYFGLAPEFTRYDHSIGVLSLLKKANCPLKEQVAGLLHDASHTAFSHLGDIIFNQAEKEHSYQDKIHLWYLNQQNITKITEKWGIKLKELNPDNSQYKALERPLPELCADRLQYNIHTGVIYNIITAKEAKEIVDNLEYKDNKWFFKDINYARKFASLSLIFTKDLWGSDWNAAFYHHFAKIIRKSLELKVITNNDIHFSNDLVILNKIKKSKALMKDIKKCVHIKSHYRKVKFGDGELNLKPKFRGIDPWVFYKNKYHRLSYLSPQFKIEFNNIKDWCNQGYGLNFNSYY